jgi:thiamine-monophosphate kinase
VTAAEVTLGSLGERRIVQELLGRRYAGVRQFGDDAAMLPLVPEEGLGSLVATTDPCPPPMAAALGATDLYFTGWLLATINLSDLAAVGAKPLGLLTSLVLPATMPVADFERLLDGVDECSSKCGTSVVGGNLKEGPVVDVSATAIGICADREPISRSGGAPGDAIVVIGDLGSFWAGVLGVRKDYLDLATPSPLLNNVLTPVPKVRVMNDLADRSLVRAAIDNSDGLYPSLMQLATASDASVRVDASQLEFDPAVAEMAARLDVAPIRLALGWGDWQVIIACDAASLAEVRACAETHGVGATHIGDLTEGTGVRLVVDGAEGSMLALESERFAADSWFSSGLDGYITEMLEGPLVSH